MKIISNLTLKDTPINIDGEIDKETDYVIYRCTLSGKTNGLDALINAKNYRFLAIVECVLKDIPLGDGINLRSTGNGSKHTRIFRNTFEKIQGSGIISKYPNEDVQIWDNELYNVGLEVGGKRHGMYILSPGARITHNLINGTNGDGITIRTTGIVEDNITLNTSKSGIRYFSDGLLNPELPSELQINNNQCYRVGAGQAAISLFYSSAGEMVEKFVIKGNRAGNNILPFFAEPEFAGRYTVEW